MEVSIGQPKLVHLPHNHVKAEEGLGHVFITSYSCWMLVTNANMTEVAAY